MLRALRFENLEERSLLAADAYTWTGGADNKEWNDAGNWGAILSFPGDPVRAGSAGDTATFNTAANVIRVYGSRQRQRWGHGVTAFRVGSVISESHHVQLLNR